ncbi:MAG TPA: MFS transporter [Rubrivivax sp.]|nr:MFS transporter [Rubrivivax sp.]
MSPSHLITHWDPEDPGFWQASGRRVAQRNLWLSVAALTLSFAVWMIWSVVVVHLPAVGFRYSTNQLFWLAALPALSGASLRFVYAFAVPLFGGRRWTTLATASLLVPALGVGLAVQDPSTPFEWMIALSLLCGLGGANFASSMAHISFFYPKSRVGTALGVNAGLGNLGVPLAQALGPLVVTTSLFGIWGGAPQVGEQGTNLWLQNAGFVWVPFILLASAAAWWGMNDLAEASGGFAQQAAIVRRRHNWLMCWLYTGSFGSFIGLAAALPLLTWQGFPGFDARQAIWLGPLLGAVARPLGGWLADRVGGARVTFWAFATMALGTVVLWLNMPDAAAQPAGPATLPGGVFPAFMGAALLLFLAAGIGNGSTFRMIPVIFSRERRSAAAATPAAQEQAQRDANRESAAALGFASAVAAYGGFFIPKSVGTSIALTGGAGAALATFLLFYMSCIAITWWFYSRRFAPMPC